jgi:hypothetical protein
MVQNPARSTPPQGLPVLSHGKHRNPSRGACFMEYTSVLAGERFTDSPRCVDAELAAVLRGANDMLTDDERAAMVPFLGRAIGLVVPAPELPAGRAGFRLRRRGPDGDDRSLARTEALRRSVAERFRREVGVTQSHPRWSWYARHTRVSRLFWELMNEPAPPETSAAYLDQLVARLDLLHRCYEEGLESLGLPRGAAPATSAGDRGRALHPARAAAGEG